MSDKKAGVIILLCLTLLPMLIAKQMHGNAAGNRSEISSQQSQKLPSFARPAGQISFRGKNNNDSRSLAGYHQFGGIWRLAQPCRHDDYSDQNDWANLKFQLKSGRQQEQELALGDCKGVIKVKSRGFAMKSTRAIDVLNGIKQHHGGNLGVNQGNDSGLFSSSAYRTRALLNKPLPAASPGDSFAEAKNLDGDLMISESRQPANSPRKCSGKADLDIAAPTKGDGTVFPFGFMGVESENLNQLGEIANLEVNAIHSWEFQENLSSTHDYLNLAAEKKLSVIQQLPGEGSPITNEQYWASYIPALSAHENLVAWYLPDEIPDYDPNLENAEDLYNWVKKYDPLARPVYGNAGTSDLKVITSLVNFTDMIWYAAYPNYTDRPRVYVTYVIKERMLPAIRNTSKSFGIIIEFFDPSSWGRSGEISTPEEIRCDVYQSLIGGACGIWFYSWRWGRQAGGYEPTLNEIATMADQIIGNGGLKEVFLSPEKKTAQLSIIAGSTQSPSVNNKKFDSIQWTQREHHGKEYLFAVNVATQHVTARFSSLPVQSGEAIVLFENRSLAVNNGQITDSFNPYEVHLYELRATAVVKPGDTGADRFNLFQNYPNPFNAHTKISYSLPMPANVKLEIYSIVGQKIQSLVNGSQEAGINWATWNGRDHQDRRVASGIYFYRLEVGDFISVKKMMLLQ